MSEKIYCGNARTVQTKFGEMTKVSFSKDDINKMVKHMRDTKADWINLNIKEKKDKVAGKPTHYLEVDDWKPTEQPAERIQDAVILPPTESGGDDNLPF